MKAHWFLSALTLVTLSIWSFVFYYDQSFHVQTASEKERQQLATLALPLEKQPFHLDAQQKWSDCHVQGPLPDHACSPGAVFPAATRDVICVPGYSGRVRNVSVGLKKIIYAQYGLSYPQPRGAFEVDHLIPLELGGNNDRSNLFPEAATPTPGFHEKDLVENYLHQEVCSGNIELGAAQELIATNWVDVYSALSPETLARLKGQFRN